MRTPPIYILPAPPSGTLPHGTSTQSKPLKGMVPTGKSVPPPPPHPQCAEGSGPQGRRSDWTAGAAQQVLAANDSMAVIHLGVHRGVCIEIFQQVGACPGGNNSGESGANLETSMSALPDLSKRQEEGGAVNTNGLKFGKAAGLVSVLICGGSERESANGLGLAVAVAILFPAIGRPPFFMGSVVWPNGPRFRVL